MCEMTISQSVHTPWPSPLTIDITMSTSTSYQLCVFAFYGLRRASCNRKPKSTDHLGYPSNSSEAGPFSLITWVTLLTWVVLLKFVMRYPSHSSHELAFSHGLPFSHKSSVLRPMCSQQNILMSIFIHARCSIPEWSFLHELPFSHVWWVTLLTDHMTYPSAHHMSYPPQVLGCEHSPLVMLLRECERFLLRCRVRL